ncbi:hypothetical protein AVEN_176597-1 [Araneus ventricosus]|uniref:Uncharacterized protein n=1 Tax=Araneus ventricosus TaxID=182803 RepID=A0A4Y2EG34_ARAVE|nr:hypothetical protein AVEN_176597-1 [Araneus ventricosus]
MVQSVDLALNPDADPSRMRSPAIDGAIHRNLHVQQPLHHRSDGMVSKVPMRTQNGLDGNFLSHVSPPGHFGEHEMQREATFAGSISCDDLRYTIILVYCKCVANFHVINCVNYYEKNLVSKKYDFILKIMRRLDIFCS